MSSTTLLSNHALFVEGDLDDDDSDYDVVMVLGESVAWDRMGMVVWGWWRWWWWWCVWGGFLV